MSGLEAAAALLRWTPPEALLPAAVLAVIGAGAACSAAADTARAAARAVRNLRRPAGHGLHGAGAGDQDVLAGQETR